MENSYNRNSLLLSLIINTFSVVIVSYILPGVHVEDFISAIWIAIVIGLLNTFLKPLLVLLTLPVTIVSLGLFLLVINALVILLASNLVSSFHVDGFWYALLFSLLMSIVNGILGGAAK